MANEKKIDYNEYRVRTIKDAVKIYAEFHPEKTHELVEAMFEKARTDHKFAELVIKCFGSFDPLEMKDVTERKPEDPYSKLTEEELRKLAGDS